MKKARGPLEGDECAASHEFAVWFLLLGQEPIGFDAPRAARRVMLRGL